MVDLMVRDGVLLQKDGTPLPEGSTVFREGELIQVKGGWFRVHAIRPKKLILKGVAKKVALTELRKDL